MYIGIHVKYPLFTSDINDTLIFSTEKSAQIANLMKTRPVRAELFHADGQTDIMKLIAAFRNFANAPSKKVPNVVFSMTPYSRVGG
jgi:hypothetical protein